MSTTRWLQHPATVFAIPFIFLSCAPVFYKLLPAGTDPSYDDTKLQRIANFMDNIYTVLANSTFIPHNGITRGPHIINATGISCRPEPSVLRLLELLPYVDASLVHSTDWIYGGHFVDYRNPKDLQELCDPLRGQNFGWIDYLAPSDIALTSWGTGGWNGDRTWVLIYNTERDAIRIFDAQRWLGRHQAREKFGANMEDWWFQEMGIGMWDRDDSAAHVLRAIANNFKTLEWIPWDTSNYEKPFGFAISKLKAFGLDANHIRDLMKRNGWPQTFDSVRFNAEVIFAKHKSHDIDLQNSLETRISTLTEAQTHIRLRLAASHSALIASTTQYDQDLQKWNILNTNLDFASTTVSLEAAQQALYSLCPTKHCNTPSPALWTHLLLSHTLSAFAHNSPNQTCSQRLQTLSQDNTWLYETPNTTRFLACLSNEETTLFHIRAAHALSFTATQGTCLETHCPVLRTLDIFQRAALITTSYERDLVDAQTRVAAATAYLDQLNPLSLTARAEVENAIIFGERDVKSFETTLMEYARLVERARKGENGDLYWVLENNYEVHRLSEYGMGGLAVEVFREYQKQTQKLTGSGDGLKMEN